MTDQPPDFRSDLCDIMVNALLAIDHMIKAGEYGKARHRCRGAAIAMTGLKDRLREGCYDRDQEPERAGRAAGGAVQPQTG